MRSGGPLLVALSAVLAAACGSTVQTGRALSVGGPGELASTPSGGLAGDLGGQPVGAGAGATTGVVGSGTSTPGGVEGRPRSQPPSGTAAVHLGPGVDARTIRVGFTIQENNATVSSLASAYNVQLADARHAYEALVSWVNSHGGVAGRKLVPTYYTYDPTGGNAAQIGQAACSALTEDASVFAALDVISGSDSFNSCLQKRGRVMLQYGLYFGTSSTWHKYSNEVAGEGLPFDTAAALLADHLAGTGFLSRSTKLGVIVRSSADLTQAYQRGFVPALARLGLGVAQTQYVQDAQDSTQISGYTADISSAVLKFRSSGIDRVVFFDVGSYAALVFSQNAERQQYRPRYGFSSLNSIVALAGSGSAAPPQQMVGAQGVSWEMNADGLTTTRTTQGKLCDRIMKDAQIVASDAGTEASYLKTCQAFFLFKAAGDLAGSDLNRDTFLAAVEHLGSRYVSTNTWGGATRFGVDDHSGASVFRPFAYRPDCSCFAVSGPAQEVAS